MSRKSAPTGRKNTIGAREALLNQFAQFKTEIDGLDIHFIHVRSPHPDAMPLVITHGWPGSRGLEIAPDRGRIVVGFELLAALLQGGFDEIHLD
jgi:pimeloyl-ACP methyl ester carboxylesterase